MLGRSVNIRLKCPACGKGVDRLYSLPMHLDGSTRFERGIKFLCGECVDAIMLEHEIEETIDGISKYS